VVFNPGEKEETVEVVATKWLNEGKTECFWPSLKKSEQSKALRAAMSLANVKEGWPLLPVLFRKSYGKLVDLSPPLFSLFLRFYYISPLPPFIWDEVGALK